MPKVFPEYDIKTTLNIWHSKVFWIHSANYYPYVFTNANNKDRDRLPDLGCTNKYIDRILINMQPGFIIKMSGSAIKYFANLIKHQISSTKIYPSLVEILGWQYMNKEFLKVKAKKEQILYEALAIPHATDWGKLNDYEKYAYSKIIQMLNKLKSPI